MARLTKARVKQALTDHRGKVYRAAEHLGCTAARIYQLIDEHDDIAAIKEHFDNAIIDVAEDKLDEKVHEGDMGAIRYVLNTKGRSRGWGERHQVEHSGPNGTEIPITFVDYRAGLDEATETED